MKSTLTNLRTELDQARQDIADATTVQQYDRARARVAYLRGLIQKLEHKYTATA